MGDIYAHGTCTIAATASKDSSGGLFFARCPHSLIPRRIDFDFSPRAPWLEEKDIGFALVGTYLCDVIHLAGKWIEAAPLNSRAWVSQERQLSRRVLHFTSTQLFWECNEGTACETYPERLPHHAQPFWQDNATVLKESLCRITNQGNESSDLAAQGLDDNTYSAWSTYRIQYSECALTHATDKLVAIQGIANRVSQATGDKFVAGLWRSRIIEELCWVKDYPMMGTVEWRAPTWSWVSTDGIIYYSLLYKFHRGHSSRHIEAELVELDVNAKASGELENASMKIKCRPVPATFTPATALRSPNYDIQGILELIDQGGKILECRTPSQTAAPELTFWLDDDTVTMGPQYGYVVVLQHCLHEGKDKLSDDTKNSDTEEEIEEFDSGEESEGDVWEKDSLEALFLRMSDDIDEKFERMGLLSFQSFRAVNQVLKAHRMAEEKAITLI